ncbi:MAG: hypothetical protein LWY06_04710, partial [Firmicutes bacterium]|nr:hypothetical protein [Bacillota bacterium]
MNQETVLEKVRLSLETVGYKPGLIKRDYKYYDFYKTGKTNSIPLACFAHRDSNFRNACIGVVFSNGLSGRENIGRHISLGTPLFFEISENTISEWKLEKKTNVEPVQIGQFEFSRIDEVFEKNKSKWMPDAVIKARNYNIQTKTRQLDFVDIGCFEYLDGILHRKFDELLKEIIRNTKSRIHSEPATQSNDYKDIFRLIFRFISAKVLHDKNHPLQWDWNNAASVLSAVENYYSINDDISKFILANQGLPEQTWEQIKTSISFNNLSVNDLAYIYENSFITNETRKEFGTH